MNTGNRMWVGVRWYEVLLALLPGLALVAQKSGLVQPFAGSSFPAGNFYAVPALSLVLVLVSLLRERRFAVWSYPALGIVLAVGLSALMAPTYLLAPLLRLSDSVNPFLAIAIVWGMLLILVVHYHLGSVVPKAFWILSGASVGFFALPSSMDILTSNGDQAMALPLIAFAITIWLGMSLLPVLIAWPLARHDGTTAALVVLGAEFFFYDTVSDPGYAVRMWTQDSTIPQMVNLLPAVGFLIICPLWVVMARSMRSQAIGFLLPSSLAVAVTELLSGMVRPYFAPDMWLRRGLGAGAFMLILALAIVAYHAVQNSRPRSENGLQPAQEAT